MPVELTEIEKAVRLTAMTEMLQAYGARVTQERLTALGNMTAHVPQHVFAQACRNAAIANESGWPPGPGQIVKAALELAPGETNPGQARSLPRWYRQALGQRTRSEQPRELGPRNGAGRPDFKLEAAGGDD